VFPRFPGHSPKILYFGMISEALISVVPKDLYSAWISEALLTIIQADLYFFRISEALLTIVYTDLYFARMSKSLLASTSQGFRRLCCPSVLSEFRIGTTGRFLEAV
jgi:hypothetical protein